MYQAAWEQAGPNLCFGCLILISKVGQLVLAADRVVYMAKH